MKTNIKKKRLLVYATSVALLMLLVYFTTFAIKPNFNAAVFRESNSLTIEHIYPVKFETIKTILFWTYCTGISCIRKYGMASGEVKCGLHQRKCFVTEDRKQFPNSSAIIFDARGHNLNSDRSLVLSMNRPPGQRWVYYNREPPTTSPRRDVIEPWNFLFNWTMTYKLDSDIIYTNGADFVKGRKYLGGYDPAINYLKGKNKTVITLISNCREDRMKLIKTLKKFIDIDVFGKCGIPCKPPKICYSYISQYKFYLAFENSICRDLLTEKAKVNALMYGTIPVIMSGANLSNPAFIPPNSFINARKFKTAKDLADFLKNVGSRPNLYNEFFKWKDKWFIHPIDKDPKEFPCRICNKLYDDDPYHQIKIYADIAGWHSFEQNCEPYPTWE